VFRVYTLHIIKESDLSSY